MAWEVFIAGFPPEIESIDQVPGDYKLPVIGSRAEIAQSVQRAFSGADISDIGWLRIDDPVFTIEAILGQDEPSDGFMLPIRGADAAVLATTQCISTNLRQPRLRPRRRTLQVGIFEARAASQAVAARLVRLRSGATR